MKKIFSKEFGYIINDETNKLEVFNLGFKLNPKQLAIGSLTIGFGIGYLIVSSYFNGAKHYELEQQQIFQDLGIAWEK